MLKLLLSLLLALCLPLLFRLLSSEPQPPSPSDLYHLTNYYLTLMTDKELALQHQNAKMSFGYSSDIDLVVDGLSVMKALGFQSPQSKHVSELNSLTDIAQTLAYYFEKGAGAEMRVNNQSAFQVLLNASLSQSKFIGLGGNAVTMAIRAQQEGSQVLLGCAMNARYYNKYFNVTGNTGQLTTTLADIRDYHLVLDFDQRDRWGVLESKRSNRFYLNYDIDNVLLTYMDAFHEKEKSFRSDIIALGGFQLIMNLPVDQYEGLFRRVKSHIQSIDYAKIHVELGSFYDHSLLTSLTENVLQFSNSLGFNEQELQHLTQSLTGQSIDTNVDSTPGVQQSMDNLVDFIRLIEKKRLPLDRFHFHSLKAQAICSDSTWGSPTLALSHSVMIAPLVSLYNYKYSLESFRGNDEEIYKLVELMTSDFPASLSLKNKDGLVVQQVDVDFKDPISCWQASAKFRCCVAPMVYSKYPLRTRGLGDNISAVGLVYHKKL